MYILAALSQDLDPNNTDAVKRVTDDITRRLQTEETPVAVTQHSELLTIELEEEQVPDAVSELETTLGLDWYAAAIRTDDTAEAIENRVLDEYSSLIIEDVSITDDQVVVEYHGEEEKLLSKEFTIQRIDGSAYLYTETMDGFGGKPLEPHTQFLLPMRDRFDVVAAVREMKKGGTPVVFVQEYEDYYEEGVAALQKLYPDMKPFVYGEDEDLVDTLNKYAEVMAVDTIVLGDTEKPELVDELDDVNIVLPLVGMEDETVLNEYERVMPLHY